MEQLQDVVVEVLLELDAGQSDAIIERCRPVLGHLDDLLDVLELCALMEFYLADFCCLQFVEVLRVESEKRAKDVFRPLHAVKSFLREHL